MGGIVFFDTEIHVETKKTLDIGAIRSDGAKLHAPSPKAFTAFIKGCHYVCGHNIIAHDLQYMHEHIAAAIPNYIAIDTLCLSPLLFPMRPYHALVKDDKLQSDSVNNPLNDSIKAKELFDDEVSAYRRLPVKMRRILCSLLVNTKEFFGFFHYLNAEPAIDLERTIRKFFHGKICSNVDLALLIRKVPIELAYALVLINTNDRHSVSPTWVLRNYPRVNNVIRLLRNTPCEDGCEYCNRKLNVRARLKDIFGFDSFRTYNGEPLQENATRAAVQGKSLLAIFPTGGGKSITFQLPALIAGETARGLTVVISPLQSLMKDQVDNLAERGIADAVTINGLLSPVERAEAMERVESGLASILYISPESLRSASIERLLLSRNVVRFVIDEAHCFSAWGQDFRVDYLYIGDFIRNLQEKRNQKDRIAVSCFTATAKQKVISDICEYFKQKLNIDLELYTTNASRTNLHYSVIYKENDDEKYVALRDLIQRKNCPTIVYVSRTKRTHQIAAKLTEDGFPALPYNGKMESGDKVANQEAFLKDQVRIIVATSAFGMGVDKKDVGLVVHYDISSSLEDYVQEAGRAGRDQSLQAECYVLFNDEDLDKHFILLNQTKLSMGEIQQVWKAIKDLTRTHPSVCRSALEIARQAGWDDTTADVETRARTAIAALENAGYVERGRNVPKIYATSILVDSMAEASAKLEASQRFNAEQRKHAKRIIKSLISSRSIAKAGNDDAESRVDYLADKLGLEKETVIASINLMREEGLLADSMDLSAFIRRTDSKNKSAQIVTRFAKLESFLIDRLLVEPSDFSYKEVNDEAISSGLAKATIKDIKTIIYYWTIRRYIKKDTNAADTRTIMCPVIDIPAMKRQFQRRIELAYFIVNYLFERSVETKPEGENVPVVFSLLKVQSAFNNRDEIRMEDYQATAEDVQNTLMYLAKIGAMDLEGGFLVLYSGLHLTRKILDNKIRYKVDDYRQLNEFYKLKIQQIHIVGEYAHMMVSSYDEALTFVNDYFAMEYRQFIAKYFKGNRLGEINRNITPGKYNKLFSELSEPQLKIVDDDVSKYIVVAAGPGSGKTRVLVHKLASLLLLEDVKHEQLLMLTFSRSAATEFKQRLIALIGNAAHYVEIKTFHSYCFDLLGKIGSLEDSADIVQRAADMIEDGEVEIGRITKNVLVIDEAQDMDKHEASLIHALMRRNEDMRVIAVGDDDQNIYEFRGSNSQHLKDFIDIYGAARYELLDNYRSEKLIVSLANSFVTSLSQRMKTNPLNAVRSEAGAVRITKHRSANLEVPIVEDIMRSFHGGTACVLTATNEEALRVMGLLLRNNISARLIQTNNGFDLYNLAELRFFVKALGESNIPTISDSAWTNAVNELNAAYGKSTCLPVCMKLLDTFASTSKTKYRTDLIEYIHESNYDDFIEDARNTVLVSTMHKAKGREFDQVYLMLNRYDNTQDSSKRALYVALTRAKKELSVHYYGGFMEGKPVTGVQYRQDMTLYPEPNEIVLQLGHKDVVLDFFKNRKAEILSLRSGQPLFAEDNYLLYKDCDKRRKLVKLSQKAQKQIETLYKKGYRILNAEIRFVVAWKNDDDAEEHAIVLPTLYFVK
ncbi:MAG: RecQ family ATP-dependent DNA helicase [Oscillospiraceae bacterium]|nr:RecQ family ATP-dependent DNA helicase [Oscillospiraceae bacterium]